MAGSFDDLLDGPHLGSRDCFGPSRPLHNGIDMFGTNSGSNLPIPVVQSQRGDAGSSFPNNLGVFDPAGHTDTETATITEPVYPSESVQGVPARRYAFTPRS